MTALAIERLTDFAGVVPARGTYGIKANVRIFKGAMVGLDSAGRAMPANTVANGCVKIVGKASATYDNRTGSVLGGAADACDVEVEYGVFAYDSGSSGDALTSDDVGKPCFAMDDQTVGATSAGRVAAGFVTEVRTRNGATQVFVFMGPHIAAALADATTANEVLPIPLASFVDADGDPIAKFASAASPTYGFTIADSEAFCIRWNNDAAPGTALCQVALPPDLDDEADMQLEFLCSKSGATLGDATTLTIAAYLIAAGDLHDADANAGGVTNALTGNAAAKTTAVLTRTIAADDIPSGARSMTFTVTPTAGTLGTDDLMLHDVRLRYRRKVQTS